jgi:hypothetical protein
MGAYINSNFFVSATDLGTPLRGEQRADDCMDAGGRATQEAKAENRSVYVIHDDLSTKLTPQSRKKAINRGAQ